MQHTLTQPSDPLFTIVTKLLAIRSSKHSSAKSSKLFKLEVRENPSVARNYSNLETRISLWFGDAPK